MDSDSLDQKRAPRKVRFQPKAQVRRPAKATKVKKEETDNVEAIKAEELMRRFQAGLAAGKIKDEKKTEPVRVAFGYGAAINRNPYDASNGNNFMYQGKARGSTMKEYKEPWNYDSYYPLTLPLRLPHSGNPDVLDEEEFSQDYAFHEMMSQSAWELGLLEDSSERKTIFIQLPMTITAMKRVTVQASASDSKQPSGPNHIIKPCGLRDMQAGEMGKMFVYQSGKVKLKLGETLYDVNTGSKTTFLQEVVAINKDGKSCANVGELQTRAILTPDVDSILDNYAN